MMMFVRILPEISLHKVSNDISNIDHFVSIQISYRKNWSLRSPIGRTWLNLVTWTCGSWSEGQHDLYFTVQWFCLISWRLFDVSTSYFRSMNPYNPTFDLKINVCHCDLYFMVQWFCLTPWRLFHVWTSLFGIINQYDLKIHVGHSDIFHGPVILPYILKTIWCMYIILSKYEPERQRLTSDKCRSLWPIFHGPVIVPYTLRTISCMNTIIWDYESVWPDAWPQN